MNHDEETLELPMILTAIGRSIAYGELDRAKKLQKLAMDWATQPEQRQAIYADYCVAAGWTGTSSWTGVTP
jgi:hypothetical protein